MSKFKTGEEKAIEITLSFTAPDVIGNYTQIVVGIYYISAPTNAYIRTGDKVKFAWFALDPAAPTLDSAKEYGQITVNGDVLEMTLESAITDALEGFESVPVYAEVELGLVGDSEPTIKVYGPGGEGTDVPLGDMVKSVLEGWS